MSRSRKQSGFALPVVIILFVVVLVGLGGIGYSYKTLQEQKELTKEETAEWKTYTNEKHGYSFRYPPECLCFLNMAKPFTT